MNLPSFVTASGTPDICDRHSELSRFLDLPPPECQINVNCSAEADIELRIRIRQSPLPEVNCNISGALFLVVGVNCDGTI